MKKGHEGKETNQIQVAEQQRRGMVACGFRARARKYWKGLKNQKGKGKIPDPDSFEHRVEVFNENKKNFIFTEVLKIYYQAKSREVALEALRLLIEAARLE